MSRYTGPRFVPPKPDPYAARFIGGKKFTIMPGDAEAYRQHVESQKKPKKPRGTRP